MDDTSTCPICGKKMRSLNMTDKFLHHLNKTGNFIERTCIHGLNHSLRMLTDKATGKVDFLNISINPKYSIYVEIDFVNQKSRINCMKNGHSEYIPIAKMIQPDFPNLESLKEKVSLYITFS